jgi:hypothetical protein
VDEAQTSTHRSGTGVSSHPSPSAWLCPSDPVHEKPSRTRHREYATAHAGPDEVPQMRTNPYAPESESRSINANHKGKEKKKKEDPSKRIDGITQRDLHTHIITTLAA